MTDVSGRTAFITGGASDIGLTVARTLARAGASIALVDTDSEKLALAKAGLGAIAPVATFQLDLRDREGMAAIAQKIEVALGPVSLLFNMGSLVSDVRAVELTYEHWDHLVGTNLGGVINSIRTFLPAMVERGHGGHIINSISRAGLAGASCDVLRATSDFGIVGLSESMEPELARSEIGVSLLCRVCLPADSAHPADATAFAAGSTRKADMAPPPPPHPIDLNAIGELVLRGVRRNSFYLHPDRSSEQMVSSRTDALIAAMPEELK